MAEEHGDTSQVVPLGGPPPPPPAAEGPGAPLGGEEWQPQTLVPLPAPVPSRGWRRAVYRASGGRVNPGPSTIEAHRTQLRATVAAPLAARTGERIAVLSTKGGVGKTTTALMLGHTLATERGDRVVALDANPDYGTLGYRVSPETPRTVRDLLDGRSTIRTYPDIRSYTTQAPSRLEVLAGDADPAVSDAFTADDYCDTVRLLTAHYNVLLTDCGTGVLHDAMRAVLAMATQLVVVAGPAVDQARHADHLLRWLQRHARPELVRDAVVVVNASRTDLAVDLDGLVDHFARWCRAVIEIPYDPVLANGGLDGLDEIDPSTRDAYLELGRAIVAGFGAEPSPRAIREDQVQQAPEGPPPPPSPPPRTEPAAAPPTLPEAEAASAPPPTPIRSVNQ